MVIPLNITYTCKPVLGTSTCYILKKKNPRPTVHRREQKNSTGNKHERVIVNIHVYLNEG